MEKLILLYLYSNPGSKARSIADNILSTRSDVNSCLYSNRFGWWYQGGEYRYFLTQKGVNAVRAFIAQTVKEKPKASKQKRPWTPEEDERLKKMLNSMVDIDRIVRTLGHNIEDVEARMKELGVEYPEEKPSIPATTKLTEPATPETPTIDKPNVDPAPAPQPPVQQDDSKYNESLVEIVEDAVEKERKNYLIIARDCVKQVTKRVFRNNHDQIYDQSENKYIYWVLENPIDNPFRGTDRFVYRNSDIGRQLQVTPTSGNYELRVRGMGKDANSFYIHNGHVFNTIDYKRHAISIEGISGQQRFSDLSLLLRKLNEQAEHGGEAPQMTGIELLKAFIHESAQLGFTAWMSPEQAKVKYNNLFMSCVIVDGGPGTGKTTTMVSRLKYLTDVYELDKDIKENGNTYAPLSKQQKKTLLDLIKRHRDWFFFTPSKLLCQYLDSAMKREGLENTGSKVKYWNDFCFQYLYDMDLFDPSKPNPKFRNLDTNEDILIYDAKAVIDDFTQYFINYCLDVAKKYPMSGMSPALTSHAENIKAKITNAGNLSLDGLIRLFKNIKREDEEYSVRKLDDLKNRIDSIMWDLYEAMSKDEDAMEYIREAIKKNNDDEPEEFEENDEEQEEINAREEDKRIRMFIRSLIKPYAMWEIRNKKPGKSKQPHLDYFEDYLIEIDRSKLKIISEIASYEPFAKLASGVTTNVLRDISRVYKKYRDDVISRRDASWNINLLQEIVSESKRNLHIQEQALLIGFLNTLYRKAPTIDHDTTSNNNVQVFLDYERPIIGVDEATDFSPIEIYAMTSFAMPDYYSITLDGDIMQRITGRGLQSWDDLNGIINEPQLFPLTVSFRQSSKMLKIAQQLYKDTTGKDPNYTADMKLQSVPDALAYVSNSDTAKLEWIEEHISQIYDIYGDRLPSIAIFLNDHEQTFNFARKLNAHDFFRDHNIKVIVGSEGETLAKANQVRVFSIDKVKGMEFDVVFFHDVDQSPYSKDLIKRYIYIGVSRAAFFLGVTMKQRNEDLLKYFNEKANWAFIE